MTGLPGGYINPVERIGQTVRRPRSKNADFTERLLIFLAEKSWNSAPKFLGVDVRGRQILGFMEGHVAWEAEQPPGVWSEESLVRVAELVRQLHDLTAGSDIAADQEVVCHNDLSPRNTVYRDEGSGYRPVAFIDWDLAGPGRRIHDVGHMCWQYLDLGQARPNAAEPARLMRVMCDAYGLLDRSTVVETVLWWQDRCWRGIEAEAAAGKEGALRLREIGAPAHVQADYEWVVANREELEKALQ